MNGPRNLDALFVPGRLAAEVQRAGVALKPKGRDLWGLCPFHDERTPSFSIYAGTGRERYKCHGCGAGGDVIDFVKRFYRLEAKEAIQRLTDETLSTQTPCDPKKPVQRRQEDLKWKRDEALRLYNAASDDVKLIGAYLRARGIDTHRTGIPDCLRLAPDLLHAPSGKRFPAMLAPIHAVNGDFIGVHRTYLRPDGTGKAPVDPAKMVLGGMRAGCIRLAPMAPMMGLAEGIETALSVQSATGIPCWSVVSLSNFALVHLPAGVREPILLGDADCKADVRTMLHDAAHRLKSLSAGRKVKVAMAAPGMDFNDMLNKGWSA